MYYQAQWDHNDKPEDFVKVYFGHIINHVSMNTFCMKYKAGSIPEENELRQILEQGWIKRYGARRYSHHEIPLGQIEQLLKYLISCANNETDCDENVSEVPLKRQKRV